MYDKHPVFITPENEDIKIWRYLDIPKFLWLLEKHALYFPRCDLLGDPFEGSLPSTTGQLLVTSPKSGIPQEILEISTRSKSYNPVKSLHQIWRMGCYVCSFHMNDHESAGLWSIYTKANQGVVIQSTFKRLVECVNDYKANPVYIGKVKYIDYQTEIIPIDNCFFPIVHKRKSFEHEKELRAVISFPTELPYRSIVELADDPSKIIEGLNVPISLDQFIEKIYLAPTTKPWIGELLTILMQKNGIDKPLEQSSLDANPII